MFSHHTLDDKVLEGGVINTFYPTQKLVLCPHSKNAFVELTKTDGKIISLCSQVKVSK